MKYVSLILLFATLSLFANASAKMSPYFKLGEFTESVEEIGNKIKSSLTENEFEVIGEYHPENNSNMLVIVYTNETLKSTVSGLKERAALASTLKVGIIRKNEQTSVFMLNPDYMFHAYLMEKMEKSNIATPLKAISTKAISALKPINKEFTAYGGGNMDNEDLWDYHYMFGMPYFTDPVTLNTFSSFEEGVKTIQNNLSKQKGVTVKVYELIYADKKVAVFGIGLHDKTIGEAQFLPIIGEEHLAAMPYEIILEGTKASMLHGRYRFALYWPELTMGTFTKIMSTPGNVESALEDLTK
ncbi:MAG: hypothetical protein JEZ03_13305 [Bacteroidales bacterium]|nr:hypothetical protein [Bacteroidales bacterium]